MFVKASTESENGQLPSEEELLEMGRFNEEMANAGVMLGGEGLHPSANGKKVRYDGDRRTVVDGPFTETKELVAGFWLIQTNSWDEALDWAKRVPFREGEVEIRQIFEAGSAPRACRRRHTCTRNFDGRWGSRCTNKIHSRLA